MAIALKVQDTDSYGVDVQEMTSTDENYLAYQMGLEFVADSANALGSITVDSNHTSVGTFTNTFFNEPVGTHPSTSITSGSTTSILTQNLNSTLSLADSDVLLPIKWVDSSADGPAGFKQFPDSDLNVLIDRNLSKIFTNDYPGAFKLASLNYDSDYSVHRSAVFTDTRTDGHSDPYNVYRRTQMSTPPSASRPLYVEDSAGGAGIKLTEMLDRQIKFSFGRRARNRMNSTKIGTYQLRSGTQGAPTDPGTWVAKGTATDTKQSTADIVYTVDSTVPFEVTYTGTYTEQYTNTYSALYNESYATPYTQSVSYNEQYSKGYGGYAGYAGQGSDPSYSSFYITNSYTTDQYQRQYAEQYIENYDENYANSYSPTYIPNYIPTYEQAPRDYSIFYGSAQQFIGGARYATGSGPGFYTPEVYEGAPITNIYGDRTYSRAYGMDYSGDYDRDALYGGAYVGGVLSRIYGQAYAGPGNYNDYISPIGIVYTRPVYDPPGAVQGGYTGPLYDAGYQREFQDETPVNYTADAQYVLTNYTGTLSYYTAVGADGSDQYEGAAQYLKGYQQNYTLGYEGTRYTRLQYANSFTEQYSQEGIYTGVESPYEGFPMPYYAGPGYVTTYATFDETSTPDAGYLLDAYAGPPFYSATIPYTNEFTAAYNLINNYDTKYILTAANYTGNLYNINDYGGYNDLLYNGPARAYGGFYEGPNLEPFAAASYESIANYSRGYLRIAVGTFSDAYTGANFYNEEYSSEYGVAIFTAPSPIFPSQYVLSYGNFEAYTTSYEESLDYTTSYTTLYETPTPYTTNYANEYDQSKIYTSIYTLEYGSYGSEYVSIYTPNDFYDRTYSKTYTGNYVNTTVPATYGGENAYTLGQYAQIYTGDAEIEYGGYILQKYNDPTVYERGYVDEQLGLELIYANEYGETYTTTYSGTYNIDYSTEYDGANYTKGFAKGYLVDYTRDFTRIYAGYNREVYESAYALFTTYGGAKYEGPVNYLGPNYAAARDTYTSGEGVSGTTYTGLPSPSYVGPTEYDRLYLRYYTGPANYLAGPTLGYVNLYTTSYNSYERFYTQQYLTYYVNESYERQYATHYSNEYENQAITADYDDLSISYQASYGSGTIGYGGQYGTGYEGFGIDFELYTGTNYQVPFLEYNSGYAKSAYYQGNYVLTYGDSYTTNFTRQYSSSYISVYETQYAASYATAYTEPYDYPYDRQYVVGYTKHYQPTYTKGYVKQYSRLEGYSFPAAYEGYNNIAPYISSYDGPIPDSERYLGIDPYDVVYQGSAGYINFYQEAYTQVYNIQYTNEYSAYPYEGPLYYTPLGPDIIYEPNFDEGGILGAQYGGINYVGPGAYEGAPIGPGSQSYQGGGIVELFGRDAVDYQGAPSGGAFYTAPLVFEKREFGGYTAFYDEGIIQYQGGTTPQYGNYIANIKVYTGPNNYNIGYENTFDSLSQQQGGPSFYDVTYETDNLYVRGYTGPGGQYVGARLGQQYLGGNFTNYTGGTQGGHQVGFGLTRYTGTGIPGISYTGVYVVGNENTTYPDIIYGQYNREIYYTGDYETVFRNTGQSYVSDNYYTGQTADYEAQYQQVYDRLGGLFADDYERDYNANVGVVTTNQYNPSGGPTGLQAVGYVPTYNPKNYTGEYVGQTPLELGEQLVPYTRVFAGSDENYDGYEVGYDALDTLPYTNLVPPESYLQYEEGTNAYLRSVTGVGETNKWAGEGDERLVEISYGQGFMDDRNYQAEAFPGNYQGFGGPEYVGFRFYDRTAPTMFYQEGSRASTNVNSQFFVAPGAGLDLSNDEPVYLLGVGNDIGLSNFMLRNYVGPTYSGGYTNNLIYYVGPLSYQRSYLGSEGFFNVEYEAPTYAPQNYAPGTELQYQGLTTTFYSRAVNNYDSYVDINDLYGSSGYTTQAGYQGITEYTGTYTDSYDRRSSEVFTGIEYYEGGYTGAYQRLYTEQYELITDYESDVEQYQSTYNSDPTIYSHIEIGFAQSYLGTRNYQRNYTRNAGSFNGFGGTLGYYARIYQRLIYFAGPSYASTPRYTSDFADYSGPIFEIYADYAGPPSLYVLQYESLYEGPGMTTYTIGYEQSGYDPQDQRQTGYSQGSRAYVGDVFPYLRTYVKEGIGTYSDSGDYDAYYTTHIYQADYNSYLGARVTDYNNYVYFGHQPDLLIFGVQYTDASNDAYGGLRYTPTFESDQGYGDYARGGTIYQGTAYDGVGEIIKRGTYVPQEYQGGLDGPTYVGQRYGGYGDRRYGGTPNFSQYGTDLYTKGYVGPPDGTTTVYERIYDKGGMPRYTNEQVYSTVYETYQHGYIAADADGFTDSVYLAGTQYIGATIGNNSYDNDSFVLYGNAAEIQFPDPTIANYEEAFAGYVSYYTSPLNLPSYSGPGGAYNLSTVGYAAPSGIIGPTYIQSLPRVSYIGFENYTSQADNPGYLGDVNYDGYEDTTVPSVFFIPPPAGAVYISPGGITYLGGPYSRAYANTGTYVASGQEESIPIIPATNIPYISYTGSRSFLDFTTADPDAQYLTRYGAVEFYGTAGLGEPGYGFYIGPGIPFGPGYYTGAGGATYTRVGYDASQFYQADKPVYNTNIYVNTYEGNEYFTNYSTGDMYTARLQQIDYGVQYYDALGDVLRYTGEYGTIYEGESYEGPEFDKAYERLYDNTFTGTYVIGYNVDIKFYSATYEPITAGYTLDTNAGTFTHAYVAPSSSTYSGPGYTGEAFIDGYTLTGQYTGTYSEPATYSAFKAYVRQTFTGASVTTSNYNSFEAYTGIVYYEEQYGSNLYQTTYSGPAIYQEPYATYIGSYQNDSDQGTYTEPGYNPTYTQRYEPLYEAQGYLRSNEFLTFNGYTQNIFEVAYEGASYTNDSNLVYGGTYSGSYTADLYTGAAYSTQYEGGTYTGATYEVYSSNYDGPNYTTAYDISYDTGQIYNKIVSSSTYAGPAVFDRAYETVYADQAKTYGRDYTRVKILQYDAESVYTASYTLIDDQYDGPGGTYVGPPLTTYTTAGIGTPAPLGGGGIGNIKYTSNYAGEQAKIYYIGSGSDTNIYTGTGPEAFYADTLGNYVRTPSYLGSPISYVEGDLYAGPRYAEATYLGETAQYQGPGGPNYNADADPIPYTDGAGNVYSGPGNYASLANEYGRVYNNSGLVYTSIYTKEDTNYIVGTGSGYTRLSYGTTYLGAGSRSYVVGDQPGENYSDYTRTYTRGASIPNYQKVYTGGPTGTSGYVRFYVAPGLVTATYTDTVGYEVDYERAYEQKYQLAYNLDVLNYTTSYSSSPVYTRLTPADAFLASYDPIETYVGPSTTYDGGIFYLGGDPQAGYERLAQYVGTSYIKASPTVIYNGFTDVNQQYTLEGIRYIGEGGYANDAGYEGQVLYTEPAVTVDYTGPDGVYGDPASYTVEFAGFEVRYDLSLSYEGSLGYQDEYLNRYQANYTEEYTAEFTGVYEQIYSEDYANEFSAIYTLDYEEPYIGTYTANYIGSFSGETIQATEEETETYTLYVRVA